MNHTAKCKCPSCGEYSTIEKWNKNTEKNVTYAIELLGSGYEIYETYNCPNCDQVIDGEYLVIESSESTQAKPVAE